MAIAGAPSGLGYWVADVSGRGFAFGDAQPYGPVVSSSSTSRIVGMVRLR